MDNKKILQIAFWDKSENDLKLNGVIEERSKLMNLSLKILKKGKLLPSGIFSIINNDENISIDQFAIKNKLMILNLSELDEIFDLKKANIEIITQAKLPIKKTRNAQIIVFKLNNDPKEYFCILIGKINNKSQL